MSKMRVVQVTRPNGLFEIVEREIPEPGAGQVRVQSRNARCTARWSAALYDVTRF